MFHRSSIVRHGYIARRRTGSSAGFYVMWLLTRDFFGAAVATLLVYSAVAVAGQASGERGYASGESGRASGERGHASVIEGHAFGKRGHASDDPNVIRVTAPPLDHAALDMQIRQNDLPERARFVSQTALVPGDTPVSLLSRLAVADPAATRFLRESPAARAVLAAPVGTEVRAAVDARQRLQSLSTSVDQNSRGARRLLISRQGSRFIARHEVVRNEVAVQWRTVRVGDALGPSLRQAGVPASVALEFARQIEGRVDLGHDVGPKDECRLVYEQLRREGAVVGHGRLLAAELTTRSGAVQMVWYPGDSAMPAAFYEPSGKPFKASQVAFIRPIADARVSSRFGDRRHPLFHSRDLHTGIDLAAAHGTRVAAAASGVVEFAGRKTGYGNLVIVRHAGRYRTYYAHLSSFATALRAGTPLQQGEIVGRVGSTGWATGTHLHFELRRGDQPIDPLRPEILARGRPGDAQLRTFRRQTERWLGQIALMRALAPPMIDS
jgi:murein DD-endopeptidase MepM/ murein hydrolase activator NlpD